MSRPAPRQPAAPVVVIVEAIHVGGRDYRYHDELWVAGEHVQQWLDSGYVRVADQQRTITAWFERDGSALTR